MLISFSVPTSVLGTEQTLYPCRLIHSFRKHSFSTCYVLGNMLSADGVEIASLIMIVMVYSVVIMDQAFLEVFCLS